MSDTLTELFAEIAAQATAFDEPVLAHLCRLAALQATGASVPFQRESRKLIGIWDWNVAEDVNHLDPNSAALFGVEPAKAAEGLPNDAYIKAIHPNDLAHFNHRLAQTLKTGGVFEAEYRVLKNGGVKRIFARGLCTLDKSNRPERLPGVLMELA
jgi:PAS domain-containing protein